MAVESVRCIKRRRGEGGGSFTMNRKKLDRNERVEVRSMEEGFLGSWHPGTVIYCGKRMRHVRYENILDDDGVYYLVDEVTVSKALDGFDDSSNRYRRGTIRPSPPLIEFERSELKFGMCVDVDYQEGWWEGVIFDRNVGMEERNVFFPDLGDEMKIGLHQMRITHDWGEVTGKWRRRGIWAFLELFEECERTLFVAVSAKQVWYDVRVKKEFDQIREWTYNVKELWKDLVMDVVNEYLAITVREISTFLDLPRSLLQEIPELESLDPTANVDVVQEVGMANSLAVNSGYQLSSGGNTNAHCEGTTNNAIGSEEIPVEKKDESSNLLDTVQNYQIVIQDQERNEMRPLLDGDRPSDMHIMADMNVTVPQKETSVQEEPVSPVQEALTQYQREISGHGAGEVIPDAHCFEKDRKVGCSSSHWMPLILSEVEFCPAAVEQYLHYSRDKKISKLWKKEALRHIAYLGWQIEWIQGKCGRCDLYRYKSPDKQNTYRSLSQVCRIVLENSKNLMLQNDQRMTQPTADSHLPQAPLDQSEKIQDLDIFPPTVPHPLVEVEAKPEFCPQAIMEYYKNASTKGWDGRRKCILKAKGHLLAEGWSYHYPDPNNRRRGLLYISPENRRFFTLHAACHFCIQQSIPKWTDSSGMQPSNIKKEIADRTLSGDLLDRLSQLLPKEPELHATQGVAVKRSTQNWKRKHLVDSKAGLDKHQSNGLPLRVLRSSKRVQQVPIPDLSHQKPLNVLSWLIDSNVVLPRSKVYYQSKGRHHTSAQGRITRDGIKCNCCLKVYSLSGFENHASGSCSRRSAASIFLEDGRSLLDCQRQIMEDRMTRETMGKPTIDLSQGQNDYICSICHYGGDLILCDKCPSSFHSMCLGLKDIPDGEWFCPSCRCTICGECKINGVEDEDFLTCIQCEHKYHARCLKKSDVAKARRYPENWLCGKDCDRIYAGLHKLLGEPVSVGMGNLTWTLVRYINSEIYNLGGTKCHSLPESYGKLNNALSVMHECFKPLKESSSTRDLVEDVIFSRRSVLNRINFQGFYIILLEKNEELISVATIRVYGKKVAEIPLVGTRLQYRRHGMCRILMNELEKNLMHLGVERLVLPAAPSVLETWTGSFGFAKMTDFERLQFLDNTFLDFQDTIMCQKLLMKSPSPDSVLSIESQQKPCDVLAAGYINSDSSSPVSEVNQAEDIDKSGMVDLQMRDACAGNNDNCSDGSVVLFTAVNQPSPEDQQCQNGTTTQNPIVKKAEGYNNGSYKCYIRRKFTTKA